MLSVFSCQQLVFSWLTHSLGMAVDIFLDALGKLLILFVLQGMTVDKLVGYAVLMLCVILLMRVVYIFYCKIHYSIAFSPNILSKISGSTLTATASTFKLLFDAKAGGQIKLSVVFSSSCLQSFPASSFWVFSKKDFYYFSHYYGFYYQNSQNFS